MARSSFRRPLVSGLGADSFPVPLLCPPVDFFKDIRIKNVTALSVPAIPHLLSIGLQPQLFQYLIDELHGVLGASPMRHVSHA